MRNLSTFVLLSCLLVVCLIFCMTCGAVHIPLRDLSNSIFQPWGQGVLHTILWKIRLPRIVWGVLVGAGLAVCGCVFQGILRNPLAEPFTLGTSGGAALGATLGIVIGSSEILGPYRLSLYAFVGAAMSISLVYIVASRGAFSIHTMILGGVILSFLFSSLVLLIFALVQVEKIHSVLRWLMGDLSTAENSLIPVVAIIILGGILLLSIWGRKIDILTLGDEKAISLGIVPNSTRKGIFILVSLIVGVCVSATGIIGFVGLIIPHFMRWTFSPGHRALIPASALAGSIYLCLSDTLARTIIHPIELPVGVVTGIIGGLFFLGILVSSRWRLSR